MLLRIVYLSFVLCYSFCCIADDTQQDSSDTIKKNNTTETDYQKIIAQYKEYLTTIKPPIRKEVQEFRKKVAEFNKQKRELYKQLSQEAQSYFIREQEFKRKLPIKNKNSLNKVREELNERLREEPTESK